MSIEPVDVLTGMAIGIGATLIMDAWNLFLKRMFSIQSLNLCWLGRWIGHMPGGTFTHANIAAAERKPFECVLGWLAHYATGVTLALAFVVLASGWRVRPTLLPALFFGMITVAFPFLVLQPSLGLGVASSRAPNPTQARLKSLMTHTVFGAGLYVCGLAVRYIVEGVIAMRPAMRIGFVIVLGAIVSSASQVAAQKQPTTVTRLYTGADGQSHAEDKDIAWRPAKLRADLSESESVKVTGAQFLRWPRGFVWAGHPASKRQYVIIISGHGEVDVVGGKNVQLAPGRVLLAEDVTGKGHTTRVGPDEDLVMLLVPLAPE